MNQTPNAVHICHAINIMTRAAGKVDMRDFQSKCESAVLTAAKLTEAEVHACGNSACFAGWVAVSPEFRASGGYASPMGSPKLRLPSGKVTAASADAIKEWLGISLGLAEAMIYAEEDTGWSDLYGKDFGDVTHEDVISVLRKVQRGELH